METPAEKRRFIDLHGKELANIRRGCRLVSLAPSTYYYRPKKDQEGPGDGALRQRIDEICGEFSGYGYRRVTRQLKDEGWKVNKKRIQRLMGEMGLQRRPKKRWVVTTDSDHDFAVYPNRLAGFRAMGINQAWVSDITYIRLLMEFVYLAVILDLYSRKVIGWAISRRIDTQLTLAALTMALEARKPAPGCIHHSDRGVQYAATDYVKMLNEAGMLISMSARGNPYDNAVAESFMKTLKVEEVYLGDYRRLEDVLAGVPHFIEAVYNQKRLHSSLGYRSPAVFEAQQQNPTSGTSQLAT